MIRNMRTTCSAVAAVRLVNLIAFLPGWRTLIGWVKIKSVSDRREKGVPT